MCVDVVEQVRIFFSFFQYIEWLFLTDFRNVGQNIFVTQRGIPLFCNEFACALQQICDHGKIRVKTCEI